MHLYFQQIYGSKHSFLPIILRTLYFKEKPYCPLRPLRGHLSQRERQVVCANFEQSDKLKLVVVYEITTVSLLPLTSNLKNLPSLHQ